jgi:NADPH:quinone reductase-like Zn-dependent oxidoreductase
MKVAAYARYGPPDVVQLIEVEKPVPKDREVLIRVRATTVNSGDWRVRSFEVPAGFKLLSRLFLGFSKPRQAILGTELAGTIEAVGSGVTRVQSGGHVLLLAGSAWAPWVTRSSAHRSPRSSPPRWPSGAP